MFNLGIKWFSLYIAICGVFGIHNSSNVLYAFRIHPSTPHHRYTNIIVGTEISINIHIHEMTRSSLGIAHNRQDHW